MSANPGAALRACSCIKSTIDVVPDLPVCDLGSCMFSSFGKNAIVYALGIARLRVFYALSLDRQTAFFTQRGIRGAD
jgi:hypothetical protein